MTGTLILALLGFLLSVVSLGWQLVNYTLTGPRAKVTIMLGVATDEGEIRGHWVIDGGPEIESDTATAPFSKEVVLVEVTNIGRSAITILSCGICAPKSRFRPKRYLAIAGSGGIDKVRLDPGDVHRWHGEVWPLVGQLRDLRDTVDLDVRGCARMGAGRVALSSGRQGRWRVTEDLKSVVPARR